MNDGYVKYGSCVTCENDKNKYVEIQYGKTNFKFVEIKIDTRKWDFVTLIKKIYYREELDDFETNKVWIMIIILILILILIYEIYINI